MKPTWVRFSWNLRTINVHTSPPVGYQFSSAVRDERSEILHVVLAAYASDPVWVSIMDGFKQRMTERIETTPGNNGSDYLIAKHGENIVGVSGVAKTHWTDQNLLTGICILPTHQRRAIGTHLLGLSLLRLREMGVDLAKVYTEAGSLADSKLYPKFGSRREEVVSYPGLAQA